MLCFQYNNVRAFVLSGEALNGVQSLPGLSTATGHKEYLSSGPLLNTVKTLAPLGGLWGVAAYAGISIYQHTTDPIMAELRREYWR